LKRVADKAGDIAASDAKPAVKLKRLKFDCAEADATSPQKTSNNSIRLLNLDLLFRRAGFVVP
jgi:hypothetical protein